MDNEYVPKTYKGPSPYVFNTTVSVPLHAETSKGPLEREEVDSINHPKHYTAHPSQIECIDVAEHMNFNLGNAIKYIWRTDLKDTPEDNLRKSLWYIRREMKRRGIEE